MIVDITNELFTKLKTDITDATLVTSFQADDSGFPRIVFVETANTGSPSTRDSGGEKHSVVAFDVNVFTSGNRKISISKDLRNKVDAILCDFYGLSRVFSGEIENYNDRNIYRYVLRYTGTVDQNLVIHRG